MTSSIKVLHWAPRILGILAILFISLFAADSFQPGLTIWQQLGAFLIHLIPSFILLALLVIAWKWEYIGGIIFTTIGLVCTPFVYMLNFKMNHSVGISMLVILMITIPFIVLGILFIVSHFKKRRSQLSVEGVE